METKIALTSLNQFHGVTFPAEPGCYRCCMELQGLFLASGLCQIDVPSSVTYQQRWNFYHDSAVTFEVPFSNPRNRPWDFKASVYYGNIAWLLH
jgi:hypothetical protein